MAVTVANTGPCIIKARIIPGIAAMNDPIFGTKFNKNASRPISKKLSTCSKNNHNATTEPVSKLINDFIET